MRGRRRLDPTGRLRAPLLADFAAIDVVVAVMETRSISKAASRLNSAPSAVSQRLTALEGLAETVLFNRTTRSVAPTEAGYRLYNRCKEIQNRIEEAEQEIWSEETQISGELHVTAPVYFGMDKIAPLLPLFLEQYPKLNVVMRLSANEKDLVSEGYDLAIRMQKTPSQARADQMIIENERIFCASPSYLADNGRPLHPKELVMHDCLIPYSASSQLLLPYSENEKAETIRVHPRLQSDNVVVLSQAARQGMGIALLGRQAIQAHLEAGELVHVLKGFEPEANYIVATLPSATFVPHKCSAFIDFLCSHISDAQ